MFDSDDSLIWQRPGAQRLKKRPSLHEFHQHKVASSSGTSNSNGPSPEDHVLKVSEKENNPYLSQRPVKTPIQRFISKSEVSNLRDRSPSPVALQETNGTVVSKKQYNPVLYSPSHKRNEQSSHVVTSHTAKHISQLPVKKDNILPQNHVFVSDRILGDGQKDENVVNNVNLLGKKQNVPLPIVKKVVHFSNERDFDSLGAHVRPRPLNADERSSPLSSDRMTHTVNVDCSSSQGIISYDNMSAVPRSTGCSNMPPAGTPPIAMVENTSVKHGYVSNQYKNFNDLQLNDALMMQSSVPKGFDPYYQQKIPRTEELDIYQLIKDQSQHISNLYKTLEAMTTNSRKNYNHEESRPHYRSNNSDDCSCKHIKSIGIQTLPQVQPQTVSVGTNTELSWHEILSMASVDHQHPQRTPFNLRYIDEDDTEESEGQPIHELDNRAISNVKSGVSIEQLRGSEVKEIALTMREVVMTTIQEDQIRPEPPSDKNREQYTEDCGNEIYADRPRYDCFFLSLSLLFNRYFY